METSVNQRIKSVFDALKISQTDLANAIGTSKQTISLTFSGKTTPKADLIEKMLQVYGSINPEYIMTGKGNMFRENTEEHKNFTPIKQPESRSSQMSEEWRATMEKMEVFYQREIQLLHEQNMKLTDLLGKPTVSNLRWVS
jgi:transcriptional regulator with XRE-family HTH domain